MKMIDDFWHQQKLDEVYMMYADDFVYHRPPFPSVKGREANRAADEGMLATFSENRCTIDEIIVEGQVAATRWTWQAVHSGTSPTQDIPQAASQ